MTITYALMIICLIGFTGLAIDVGYVQWSKRRMQSAADAAAMGALRELEVGNTSNLTLAARNDAGLNGFVNGQNNTTVSVNNPPVAGSYLGNPAAVEAIVNRTVPTYFMKMFAVNNISLRARAVARTTTSEGTIGGCIFALDTSAKSALSINGTSLNLHTSCSAIVESNDPSAFTMGSGAIFYLNNGAHVGVVGGWSLSGQSGLWDVKNNVAENPVTNTNPGDPLARVTTPTVANIPDQTIRSTGTVTYGKTNMPLNNQLQPGIYCGGVNFNDTNGVWITLQPGVYVLAGGGMTVNSSAMVRGTGVTFYNTSSTGWGCAPNAYAPLSLSGQGTVNFKAPTSGFDAINLTGMLFFEDRSIVDSRANKIVGGSDSSFDGALYFKNSPLNFAGTNSTNGYMVLVADTISISGTTTLGNNYASLSNPNPFAPASTGGGLVE